MSTSCRFAVAIHVLTLLAYGGGAALTSEFMAGSVNTNPVVIRRILAALRAAKLVSSQGGPGGGWQLVRPPEAITLRDVCRAVEEGTLFPLHSQDPNPHCPVGANIQTALTAYFEVAHQALERELARTTIADVMHEVKVLAS